MSNASGPVRSVVRRTPLPWIVLAYFLLGPPVAGTVFLSILALGTMRVGQWIEALPPFIGITYAVAGLPALLIAVAAAFCSGATRWWLRVAFPALTALVTGFAAVWWIVRLGEPPQGILMVATVVSSVTGALAPGLLMELLRRAMLEHRSGDGSAGPPLTGG